MPNFQIVSGRRQPVAHAPIRDPAEDIANAAQTLLGFIGASQDRKARAAEGEANRSNALAIQNAQEKGATGRSKSELESRHDLAVLGFGHEDTMQERGFHQQTAEREGTEQFAHGERLGSEQFASGQNAADRTLRRYGIDTDASTARRGQDLSHEVGMAGVGVDRERLGLEGRRVSLEERGFNTTQKYRPMLFSSFVTATHPFGPPQGGLPSLLGEYMEAENLNRRAYGLTPLDTAGMMGGPRRDPGPGNGPANPLGFAGGGDGGAGAVQRAAPAADYSHATPAQIEAVLRTITDPALRQEFIRRHNIQGVH